MFSKLIIASLSVASVFAQSDCTFDIDGTNYDLSPLVASNGSYIWTQEFNMSGTVEELVLELQICGPVTSAYSACSSNSAVNALKKSDTRTCDSYGDGTVYSVDENPEKDGVFITYYHGTYINDISSYSSLIYIVCQENEEMSQPFLEHYRQCADSDDGGTILGGQFHFSILSKYACPSKTTKSNKSIKNTKSTDSEATTKKHHKHHQHHKHGQRLKHYKP